ncbi:MAG: hypothetical protein KatS3mg050_1836 [Litorilinea sp.]|nr:MAG: hypothetical protein KatS3mg050_1836 [Litorilinea sp.]
MRSVDKTPAREWQGSRAAGYAVNVNGVSAPSVPGSGGAVNPQIAALEWLAGQGARFALVEAGGKKPLGGGWQNTPHDLAAAMKHARRGGNIGLLCGQPSGGIVAIDVDRDYEPVVEALGPFANTVRVVRDNAPGRGKLLYRVQAPTPSQTWTPAGWEPAEGEKRSPWAELLSDGRHALVPPSTYDGGHYVLRGQEYGIADLNEEELAFVWYKITDGRPGLPEPAQEDNRGRDQGRGGRGRPVRRRQAAGAGGLDDVGRVPPPWTSRPRGGGARG